ncbi:MAG: DUF2065 family protein [candidate division Zixibacteria bacterium]|nr:DUF2065 family protein [candidate division Zixibacteria bacterium]
MRWIVAGIGIIISIIGLFVTIRTERAKEIFAELSESSEGRLAFLGNLIIAIGMILLIVGVFNFWNW